MVRALLVVFPLLGVACATTRPASPAHLTPPDGRAAEVDPAWADWADATSPPPLVTLEQVDDEEQDGAPDYDDAYAEAEEAEAQAAESSARVLPASSQAKPRAVRPTQTSVGARIAGAAKRWVGLRSLRRVSKRVTDDCSGLVRLAYERVGVDVFGDQPAIDGSAVKAMYQRARALRAIRRRAPKVGDLVFFRNTYDRNNDGRRNDGLTHVGIVEKVERDGTVVFIHRGGQGVVRARMNLAHPHQRTDAKGRVLNDFLRRPDGTKAPRLAGQLFAGYASPEPFLRAQSVARGNVRPRKVR